MSRSSRRHRSSQIDFLARNLTQVSKLKWNFSILFHRNSELVRFPAATTQKRWNKMMMRIFHLLLKQKKISSKWLIRVDYFQMSQPRQRLNSMSDHSSPSSEASDNSETFDVCDLRLDNMNLEETSLGTEVSDVERQQIESFLSGLGTEVSFMLESRRWWSLITCFGSEYEVSLPSATIAMLLPCTLTSSETKVFFLRRRLYVCRVPTDAMHAAVV